VFRSFFISILGFIAGAVVTYLAVVIGTTVVWDLLDVHDQDGGGSMALGFIIGPFFALFGGIVGVFLALRITRPR
jgi:hypothetical protein